MTVMMTEPRGGKSKPVPPSGLRVLIAEDDPGSRWALSTLLGKLGYRCEVATNGREAIEKVEAFAPEAIVMDLMMPELGGLEATRLLKADRRTSGIPVLVLTALATTSGASEARSAGCDDFLTKPVVLPDLLASLRRLATHDPATDPS